MYIGRYVTLIVLSRTVLSMAWHKIVIQRYFVEYHAMSHLSIVLSRYTQKTTDSWDIPCYNKPFNICARVIGLNASRD